MSAKYENACVTFQVGFYMEEHTCLVLWYDLVALQEPLKLFAT